MRKRYVELAKYLLPPIALHRARWLLQSLSGHVAEWEYVKDGWESRSKRGVRGWDVASTASIAAQKWTDFQRGLAEPACLGTSHESLDLSAANLGMHNTYMSFGYVLGRVLSEKRDVSILDWGGALGHYAEVAKALYPTASVDYTCAELPAFCKEGGRLNPDCAFVDREDDWVNRRYELVVSSSALQYVQDYHSLLVKLRDCTKGYLYLTRMPFVTRVEPFVLLQRPYKYGYETEYLCWVFNHSRFIAEVERLGLKLIREFLVDESPLCRSAPERPVYRGFLFAK